MEAGTKDDVLTDDNTGVPADDNVNRLAGSDSNTIECDGTRSGNDPVDSTDANVEEQKLLPTTGDKDTVVPAARRPEYSVCLETKGTLRAVYGAKQFIQINPFKLE